MPPRRGVPALSIGMSRTPGTSLMSPSVADRRRQEQSSSLGAVLPSNMGPTTLEAVASMLERPQAVKKRKPAAAKKRKPAAAKKRKPAAAKKRKPAAAKKRKPAAAKKRKPAAAKKRKPAAKCACNA